MDEIKKSVDDSWKEQAEKEKEALKNSKGFIPPEADFSFFITTLALQASIFLGAIPNPVSNKKEEDLPQAKFIIDTLGMLKDKTVNNLKDEEGKLLENVLYELRMQYLDKTREVKS
jgi:predicted metal-dependent peptidase